VRRKADGKAPEKHFKVLESTMAVGTVFSARLSVSIPHIRTMFRENPRERYYATNVAVKKNCARGFAQAHEKAYKD
jgi:hypothetical protein